MAGTNDFLPYGRQWIDAEDEAAVLRALRSDFLTTGPEVDAFEAEFAAAVGARFAVACSTGTAALQLAAHAVGVGSGDKVVVPAVTFLATANAPHSLGAEIIFADVDPETGLMTPETFAEALTRADGSVKAAFPVHLAGAPCAMEAIAEIACANGVDLIEDACHGLGGEWRAPDGRTVKIGDCAFSRAATFSFHPVKTIACGEGGMVTTNDGALAGVMARMRTHGMTRRRDEFENEDDGFDGAAANPWWYEMPEPGWNHRLPDMAAALGRSQLAKLAMFGERRRALSERYRERLGALAPLVTAPIDPPASNPVRHLMNLRVDFDAAGLSRRQVMDNLKAMGVGSQVHYIPVPRQPYYRRLNPKLFMPGANDYYGKTLSVPLHPQMTDDDVDRVAKALERALGA